MQQLILGRLRLLDVFQLTVIFKSAKLLVQCVHKLVLLVRTKAIVLFVKREIISIIRTDVLLPVHLDTIQISRHYCVTTVTMIAIHVMVKESAFLVTPLLTSEN
jgi:hypothetical protein